MNNDKKTAVVLLSVLGLFLIFFGPFIPEIVFQVLGRIDNYHFPNIRYENIIPSVRTGGIILSIWAMILFCKWYKK